MTRIRAAMAILSLLFAAPAFAAAPDDAAPVANGRPIVVMVATTEVAHAGKTADDPQGVFVVVNLKSDACYAVAPPTGASVAVGENYALVVATDVDQEIAGKIRADYPKCTIVDAVARVTR